MSTDIEVVNHQLSLLARELAPLLQHGLPLRLTERASELTGIGAGIEALRALLDISKFVGAGNNERDAPREALIEQLCANLDRFCEVKDVPARVAILFTIQFPMEILLAEIQGPGASRDIGDGPLALRLASDVQRLLERADTFAGMARELSALSSATRWDSQARRVRVAEFCERYAAYSALLDFEDGSVLEDDACRAQLREWLQVEARDLLSLGQRVHQAAYGGSRASGSSSDWRSALAADALRPVLASLLAPGVDILVRLCRHFEDAVKAEGGDPTLYRRFTDLYLKIEEFERSAAA